MTASDSLWATFWEHKQLFESEKLQITQTLSHMLKQELARELLIFVKFHKTQGAVCASESTVNRGHVAKKEIIPKSCSEQSAGMPECVRECACIVRLKAY